MVGEQKGCEVDEDQILLTNHTKDDEGVGNYPARFYREQLPSLLDDVCDSTSVRGDTVFSRNAVDLRSETVPARDGDDETTLEGGSTAENTKKCFPEVIMIKCRSNTKLQETEEATIKTFKSLETQETTPTQTMSASVTTTDVKRNKQGRRSRKKSPTNSFSRLDELHAMGKRSLFLKRTLGYIQAMEDSRRSIMFDISWNEKREKERIRSRTMSASKGTSRLYGLSKTKQVEGKKRRDEATQRSVASRKARTANKTYFDLGIVEEENNVIRNMEYSAKSVGARSFGAKTFSARSLGARSKGPSVRSTVTGGTGSSSNTHYRLYNLSKHKQEEGKRRREMVSQRRSVRSSQLLH